MAAERTMQQNLDVLNWPVIVGSFSAVHFWEVLWANWPTPTAVYTVVTTGFMLFQMADKMGWLDRFKRKPKKEHHR